MNIQKQPQDVSIRETIADMASSGHEILVVMVKTYHSTVSELNNSRAREEAQAETIRKLQKEIADNKPIIRSVAGNATKGD